MTVNDELEGIWKEVVMAYFSALFTSVDWVEPQ
jgi:hypothetical protein